jgi:hypothetical protein
MWRIFTQLLNVGEKSKCLINQTCKQYRARLFKINTEETSAATRGFIIRDIYKKQKLEDIGLTFLYGYHLAIADAELEILATQLNVVKTEMRGFAFEGAAMGLALLDYFTPWQRNRLKNFLSGIGINHIYMGYVGTGWLLARIPGGIQRYLRSLNQPHQEFPDPLLGWLAVDGYGFHAGYFHHQHYLQPQNMPSEIDGYALRVFDQGLGRSLWFIYGADIPQIAAAINTFNQTRQGDLWSGVGLACAYAGGVNRQEIATLREFAGLYLPHLAQGVAFAAKARERAGNPTSDTEMACQVLLGISAQTAAEITDKLLIDLPYDAALPAYEIWRQLIQKQFATLGVPV